MSKSKLVQVGGVMARCVLVSHPRAKRVRITVLSTRTVRITKPTQVTERNALLFAERNAGWIMNQLSLIEEKVTLLHDDPEHFRIYKEKAREMIIGKVKYWSRYYNFEYGDIRIKRQRTMWGSCSSKKNLNFNYRLIFLPERLIDYVVVHEICHLREMNHSKRFWTLVENTIPNYKELRSELRRYL